MSGHAGVPDEAVRAAAEAIEDGAIRLLGRDLGTIHRDDIVRAGLAAALPVIAARVRAEAETYLIGQLGTLWAGELAAVRAEAVAEERQRMTEMHEVMDAAIVRGGYRPGEAELVAALLSAGPAAGSVPVATPTPAEVSRELIAGEIEAATSGTHAGVSEAEARAWSAGMLTAAEIVRHGTPATPTPAGEAMREALQHLADHGLSADLTPTMQFGDEGQLYAQFTRYLQWLDTGLRQRARQALAPVTPTEQPEPGQSAAEVLASGEVAEHG